MRFGEFFRSTGDGASVPGDDAKYGAPRNGAIDIPRVCQLCPKCQAVYTVRGRLCNSCSPDLNKVAQSIIRQIRG